MKGDFKYHVKTVRCAFRYGAAMRAVLDPMMAAFYKNRPWLWVADANGHRYRSGPTPENVASAFSKLRRAWRRCIECLYEQGCLDRGQEDPQDIVIRYRFMRNCPPFGIYPFPKGRTCEHRLCPFCYGRRLIEGFKHIEMRLYGTLDYKTPDGRKVEPLFNDSMLVGFQVLHYARKQKGEIATPREINQYLPRLLDQAMAKRTAESDAFNTVAGQVGFRVWCDMTNGMGVERSGILLVRPSRGDAIKNYVRKHAKPNTRFVFVGRPTKQKMASLFADIFRYPIELLRCNSEVAAVILSVTEKRRLWARVGATPVSCETVQSNNRLLTEQT